MSSMDRTVSTLGCKTWSGIGPSANFPALDLEPRMSAGQEILADGRNLREVFDLRHPKPPAESTALVTEQTGYALARVELLLGLTEPDFDGGRVALLVCPGCLEVACGALSVEVRRTEDTVIWAEAGWQDDAGEASRAGPRRIGGSSHT